MFTNTDKNANAEQLTSMLNRQQNLFVTSTSTLKPPIYATPFKTTTNVPRTARFVTMQSTVNKSKQSFEMGDVAKGSQQQIIVKSDADVVVKEQIKPNEIIRNGVKQMVQNNQINRKVPLTDQGAKSQLEIRQTNGSREARDMRPQSLATE